MLEPILQHIIKGMIHFNYYRCPKCRKIYDFWFFGLSTMIGPEYIKCSKCQEVSKTPRLEWKQFDGKTKVKSVAVSALYLGFIGYVLGYYISDIENNLNKKPITKLFDVPYEEFWYYHLSGAMIVLSILLMKFTRSHERFNRNPDEPSQEGLFSFSVTWGMQVKVLVMVVLIYFSLGLL